MHAVLLPVGEDRYAVPVDEVRQVVAAPAVTALVTAPDVVLGLFNLRGEIVPLLDVAALLGLGASKSTAFAVVVNTASGPAGLATTEMPEQTVLEPPIGASELPATEGICRTGQGVAVLINLPGLLGGIRDGSS